MREAIAAAPRLPGFGVVMSTILLTRGVNADLVGRLCPSFLPLDKTGVQLKLGYIIALKVVISRKSFIKRARNCDLNRHNNFFVRL